MNLKFLNNRRFKHGSLATVITVVFIAAVVLVNVIVGILLDRYPLTIDLSADNRFELTQDSIDFVRNLDTPIEITVCSDELTFRETNQFYTQAYEIIRNYSRYSDNITVEFVDLVKNPNFAREFPEYTLSQGSIIVKSDLRSRHINASSLFSQTQNQITNQYVYSSQAEQNMTSALMYVTDENPTTAVLLTGISSIDLSGYTSLLESNNYSIKEQNLLTEDIDPESAFAILAQPTADLTSEQAQKLTDYLDNNGKFGKNLVFVASGTQEVGPILKAFLADWGMEIGTETIIETDSSHAVQNAFTIINEVADSDLKETMNTVQYVVATATRPINLLFETNGIRRTNVLLQSYDSSVLLPADYGEDFDAAAQEHKSYPTVVKASRSRYEGTELLESNIVAFASETMFNSTYLSYSAFANSNAAVSITNSIAEKEDGVRILPVIFDTNTITINEGQVRANMIIFMIALPIITFVIGLVIWLRRRHL